MNYGLYKLAEVEEVSTFNQDTKILVVNTEEPNNTLVVQKTSPDILKSSYIDYTSGYNTWKSSHSDQTSIDYVKTLHLESTSSPILGFITESSYYTIFTVAGTQSNPTYSIERFANDGSSYDFEKYSSTNKVLNFNSTYSNSSLNTVIDSGLQTTGELFIGTDANKKSARISKDLTVKGDTQIDGSVTANSLDIHSDADIGGILSANLVQSNLGITTNGLLRAKNNISVMNGDYISYLYRDKVVFQRSSFQPVTLGYDDGNLKVFSGSNSDIAVKGISTPNNGSDNFSASKGYVDSKDNELRNLINSTQYSPLYSTLGSITIGEGSIDPSNNVENRTMYTVDDYIPIPGITSINQVMFIHAFYIINREGQLGRVLAIYDGFTGSISCTPEEIDGSIYLHLVASVYKSTIPSGYVFKRFCVKYAIPAEVSNIQELYQISDPPFFYSDAINDFDDTATYAVGDYCRYDDGTYERLYQCHTAITTAGDWTGITNWTLVTPRYNLDTAINYLDNKGFVLDSNGYLSLG